MQIRERDPASHVKRAVKQMVKKGKKRSAGAQTVCIDVVILG